MVRWSEGVWRVGALMWAVAVACAVMAPTRAGAQTRDAERVRAERAKPAPSAQADASSPETAAEASDVRESRMHLLPPGQRALSIGASIVPGALIHGTGHWVAGESDAGWTLFAAEGIGLGMIVGGIVGLALNGAAPRYTSPLIGTMIHGFGLFSASFFADVYGVAAPAGGTGAPLRVAPTITLRSGYQYAYNPTFAYRSFTTIGAEGRLGAWALGADGAWAIDDQNARARFTAAWRPWGPEAGDDVSASDDGSFVDLIAGATIHRYGTERFTETTWEAEVRGRWDLVRTSPTLRGAFVESGLGIGVGTYYYDGLVDEPHELLLGNVGFGAYLGHGPGGWGEAALYYDHRHDGYAAGFKMPGLGSGNGGHFGARAEKSLWGDWGLGARYEVGSAHVVNAHVIYRAGGQR